MNDPNDPIEPIVGDETDAAAGEIARLRAENCALRALAQQSACAYGHRAPDGVCQLGYPGCACADDLIGWDLDRGPTLAADLRQSQAEVARLTAERDALRCRAPVVITMDADDLRSEIGRMIGAAMPAEVNATVAERDALRTFAMRIAAACPVSGGEPLDLDHLAETVRRRLAGGAPVHRGPPHDWPPLINGDCEGDGEPEILCEACGEEGYHCYCGEGLCRYCGGDCGESGCHDVSDADEVSHG